MWSTYGVSRSNIQLDYFDEEDRAFTFMEIYYFLTSACISVKDSDNYSERCLAYSVKSGPVISQPQPGTYI